jgi:zinc/manganese transport system substrate-binding protein
MQGGERARTVLRGKILVAALGLWVVATGCTVKPAATTPGAKLVVVAAENFWGSIAAQLGGDRVRVTSIVSNPNADPHDYEPTAADARSVATAQLVILNGIGYDPWIQKLLDASPSSARAVMNIGDVVGVPVGGNPHQWYSPPSVNVTIGVITNQYSKLSPADASYFLARRNAFLTWDLKEWEDLIHTIQGTYAGTPVGASESIFAELAPALMLNLITPPSFLKAISEGTEPNAADKATIDRQIQSHEIAIYVYNSQNATPDVQRQIAECHQAGIPVTDITETLVPAGATFQQWQAAEFTGIAAALAKAKSG